MADVISSVHYTVANWDSVVATHLYGPEIPEVVDDYCFAEGDEGHIVLEMEGLWLLLT